MQEIKDGVRELRRLMELQYSAQGKGSDGSATSTGSQTGPKTSSANDQTPTHGVAFVPKYSRLEFPSYNGTGDPLGWLYRCEQFFSNQRTEERDKVGLAAFHMTEEAQLWYYRLEQEEPGMNWVQFKSYCLLRFGPPLTNNPLGELINLKQTGTIEEYQRQFQTLLARATTVRSDQQVDMFTAGLVETLRVDVEMQNPPNLVTAMNLARAFERKIQLNRGSTNTWRPQATWAAPKALETSLQSATSREQKSSMSTNLEPQTNNNSKSVSSAASNIVAPPIRRLSKAEMSERRAKGQCFNCDEFYSAGHKCKRLFCLLVDESEDVGT